MFQIGLTGLLGSLGAVSKVVLLLLFVFSVVCWAIIFLKWRAFSAADRMDHQFMALLAKAKDLDDLCRQVRRRRDPYPSIAVDPFRWSAPFAFPA